MSKVPILFNFFCREKIACKSFESIRIYQPAILYLAADGPRSNQIEDKCELTRKSIESMIDWNCDVKKFYRDDNIGCDPAMAQNITWFFNNEEYGVILEEDCVVSQDFFEMCEELLPYYKNEERVKLISSQNYSSKKSESNTFVFQRITATWGWASWKRSWLNADLDMSLWQTYKLKDIIRKLGLFQGLMMYRYWISQYRLANKEKSPWDFGWSCSIINNNGFCICPEVNLSKNIGIGTGNSTHYAKTDKNPFSHINIGKIVWPLVYPSNIEYSDKQLQEDKKEFFRIRMIGLRKKIRTLFHY